MTDEAQDGMNHALEALDESGMEINTNKTKCNVVMYNTKGLIKWMKIMVKGSSTGTGQGVQVSRKCNH